MSAVFECRKCGRPPSECHCRLTLRHCTSRDCGSLLVGREVCTCRGLVVAAVVRLIQFSAGFSEGCLRQASLLVAPPTPRPGAGSISPRPSASSPALGRGATNSPGRAA